jgi:hypothetical protein
MDAETARIRAEIDKRIASTTNRSFILFVDPRRRECGEVEKFLIDRGYRLNVIDVTDPEGERIFELLPIDISSVPVLYTVRDWYIGRSLIEASINEGLL